MLTWCLCPNYAFDCLSYAYLYLDPIQMSKIILLKPMSNKTAATHVIQMLIARKKTEHWNRMDMNGKIWKVRKRSRKRANLPLFGNLMLQYVSTFFWGLFLFQKHGCQESPKLLYDTIFQGSFIWVNMVLVRPPGAQLLVLGAACGAVDT